MTNYNQVYGLYLLCSSLLVLKMMALIVFTVFTRMRHKVFISEEDAKFFKGEVKINSDVERIRRAVQNDLENILPFIVISYFYIYTNPPRWMINFLFITFVIVRFLHSIVYAVIVVPQPTRAILAVQNDLENILPFIVISYFYITTNTPKWIMYSLFITFVIVRFLHSIVYAVIVAPQPTRAILWGIGFVINGIMAITLCFHGAAKLLD